MVGPESGASGISASPPFLVLVPVFVGETSGVLCDGSSPGSEPEPESVDDPGILLELLDEGDEIALELELLDEEGRC